MTLPWRSSEPLRLAELVVAAGHVEDVVDDLEEDAELGGEAPVGASARLARRRPGRAPSTTLAAISRPVFSECRSRSDSASAPATPVTSTYWPPTMPSTPVAAAISRIAARTPVGLALLALGDQADRLGEERVAGEDRDVLAERRRARSGGRGAARRRPSPAGRRGSASRCGSARSRRRSAAALSGSSPSARPVARQRTGPDPLAAGEQRVAHRLVEAGGLRSR